VVPRKNCTFSGLCPCRFEKNYIISLFGEIYIKILTKSFLPFHTICNTFEELGFSENLDSAEMVVEKWNL